MTDPAATSGTVDHLRDLIDKYWDIAWCEGRDGRHTDNELNEAQICRSGIESLLSKLAVTQNQLKHALTVADEVRKDLIGRAEPDDDGVMVVNLSNSKWEALKELCSDQGQGENDG